MSVRYWVFVCCCVTAFCCSLHVCICECSHACYCNWTWGLQAPCVVLLQSEGLSGGIESSAGSSDLSFRTHIILIELNIDPRRPNCTAAKWPRQPCQAGRTSPGPILQRLTQTWRTCDTLLCSSDGSSCEAAEVCCTTSNLVQTLKSSRSSHWCSNWCSSFCLRVL